jgi:lipopolysaccharide export system permease protein
LGPTKKSWLAENYSFRELNQYGENIDKGAKIEKDFGFDPNELIYEKSSTNLMILPELMDFIEKERNRGADNVHYYLLDLYQRYMTPFTTFILTLIGFSLAIHKKRDGTGLNLVYGFILTTLFILFQKISITFTTNSDLNPFVAILLPNIVFGIFAYYLFQRAER